MSEQGPYVACPFCGHAAKEHDDPGCSGCRNAGHVCAWVAPCRYCGDVLPDCRCVRSLRAAEGLLPKYHVKRNNDQGGKHDDCRYFVLDPEHDLVARRALAYYANDAREEGYTALADDLEAWVRALWDAPTKSGGDQS
jgi:hypothetical protein